MLVCFLFDSKFDVSMFFFFGDKYLGDGATDQHEILHNGRPIT